MARAIDVAAYILDQCGSMSTWKLQKLLYYSQAWHLVWDDVPLFDAHIEAWANGPVVRELYDRHRGQFQIRRIQGGDPKKLTDDEEETVDIVLEHYAEYNGQQLSDLTHSERPWRQAREGLESDERGSEIITLESMAEYYSSLD